MPRLRTLERKAIFEKEKRDRESSRKEEKVKHLSDEEKWNWMSVLITFPFYAVCIILAVLALYFTNGPTNEDLIHGCQFMLALVVLVTIYVLATRGPRGF